MSAPLYHGTDSQSLENIVTAGINLSQNPRGGDFGVGFYLTPNLCTAKTMALRKAFEISTPSIVELTLAKNFESLSTVKDFGNIGINSKDNEILYWAQFIVNNRCGLEYINSVSTQNGLSEHNLDKRYDIVIGTIADGSVTRIARRCRAEKRLVTLPEAKDFLDKSFGIQYCICTKHGLSMIDKIPREKRGVSWR